MMHQLPYSINQIVYRTLLVLLCLLLISACGSTSTIDGVADQPEPIVDTVQESQVVPAPQSTRTVATVEPTPENSNVAVAKEKDEEKQITADNTESTASNSATSDLSEADAEPIITASNITNSTEPTYPDLLARLRDGFQFDQSIIEHARQQGLVKRYRQRLINNPKQVARVINNAEPYLYFVLTELERNQLPLELALIPIIESHYDPFAYSPGRASGLWQFIPSTGRRFDLTQDWWQDERRDTLSSTGAAIQYFTYLHKRF